MFLAHSYKETIVLLDSEGRSYRIKPNEPWEVPPIHGTDISGPKGQPAYKEFDIPAHKVAEMLIKQAVHYGLVAVPENRSSAGITFDMDSALKASTVSRRQAEDAMVQAYVKGAKEDELGKMPIRPPSAPIQRILDERGQDLKRDFGIQPVGWKLSDGAAQRDAQLVALQQQNDAQAKEMAELKEMLTMLLDEKKKARKVVDA